MYISHSSSGNSAKPKTSIYTYLALIPMLLISAASFSQNPESILATSRRVADKIIDETSFEYQKVLAGENSGISRYTINTENESGGIYYALSYLDAPSSMSAEFGLSFQGKIKIYINDSEVFSGYSNWAELLEYSSDQFKFQNTFNAELLQGSNKILIKSSGVKGLVKVLLFPLGKHDRRHPGLEFQNIAGLEGKFWKTCGPWKPSEMYKDPFPPETSVQESYLLDSTGSNILSWELPEAEMIKQITIPPKATFTDFPYSEWHYANSMSLMAIKMLYEISMEEKYSDYVNSYGENVLQDMPFFEEQYFTELATRGSFYRLFRMSKLEDTGGAALILAELQNSDETNIYSYILEQMLDYVLYGQERLFDMTFSRSEPEAETVWAEDLFMALPFLLRMAATSQSNVIYDDVAHQVLQFNAYLQDPSSGLYYHGWHNLDQVNSPAKWGRANGLLAWATSEVLMLLPEEHPQYDLILDIFRKHMRAIAASQSNSGMWYQVLDHPETFKETSATAMFVLCMARGLRMGWLDRSYKSKALKGWEALEERIESDGTVKDISSNAGMGSSIQYYDQLERKNNDPHGLGAIVSAGCELYLLLND